MTFETSAQVRFAHIDAAGIVFYPRYFEMLNAAVEDWFAKALNADFHSLHAERGLGVPSVKVEAEFLAPSLLGEILTIRIEVLEVGRTSCTYRAIFSCGETQRVKAVGKLVCMSLAEQKSVPWPDDIRARLTQDPVCA
tara:strand:- start:29446 stop:29859 length:414 start_codon:yes stop_codon:yes gene_type:complete